MPAATGRLALPYPVAGDAADVPKDVKALADRVEALTTWIRNADIQSGAISEPQLAPALAARVVPQVVTAVPAAGQEGDRVIFATAAMQALGLYWDLRFVASLVTYRWVFMGGAPLHSGSSAAAVANIPVGYTADPAVSVALPAAGVYRVEYGAAALVVGAGQSVNIAPSAGGGAPAVPADATLERIGLGPSSAMTLDSLSGAVQPVTFTGPGNLVRLYEKANVTAATPAINTRWLSLIPIALG